MDKKKVNDGRSIYFAIKKDYPDCTRESIEEKLKFPILEAQYKKIYERVHKKEKYLEINELKLSDDEVLILEDADLTEESLKEFVKFCFAVQSCGGIRKGIRYLKLMIELQRNYA